MENTNQQAASSDTPTQAPVAQAQTEVQTNIPATQAQTQQAQPALPEKYELKLGDQSPLDQSYLESFQAYAKEQKMTQDQAQKLIEREAYAVNEFAKKQAVEFENTQKSWVDSVKKDPEIGGEGFQKNIELAHRALKKYGTPSFVQELENTGYGNHPELVRIFSRIGKAMGEDQIVSTNTNSGGKKSYEEVFYGSPT